MKDLPEHTSLVPLNEEGDIFMLWPNQELCNQDEQRIIDPLQYQSLEPLLGFAELPRLEQKKYQSMLRWSLKNEIPVYRKTIPV